MVDAMMPVINPAGVAEILRFGLLGFAMSRYAGCWVGLKCVHDTVNTAASVDLEGCLPEIRLPDDYELPPGGLNIRWPDTPLAQEERLHRHKLEAARAFARANRFDRLVLDSPQARLGVVTTGKSYLDVRQALDDLGIDAQLAARLGLRVLKLGLVWPLDAGAVREFARGLEQIVVVEEKRGLIETQLKELLYGHARAAIVGKQDEQGESLFPSHGALSSNRIARVLAERILRLDPDDGVAAHLAALRRRDEAEAELKSPILRTPYFCPGCPHNTSTRVPDGSVAKAGIGCHYMAQWMDRSTAGYTQMGAEGANWVGEAPFSKRPHVFQNIGDGTYYHSGLLAIRAAVAVGRQRHLQDPVQRRRRDDRRPAGRRPAHRAADHAPGAGRGRRPGRGGDRRARQISAARRLRRGRDGPPSRRPRRGAAHAARGRGHHGADLRPDLRGREAAPAQARPDGRPGAPRADQRGGVRGLRRLRRRVQLRRDRAGRDRVRPQAPDRPVVLQQGLFLPEGLLPELRDRARRNAEEGPAGDRRRRAGPLPEPALPDVAGGYGIVIGGVGGTGVVTIGALLGMAAHLEGKGAAVLDMTGLAQKGGAVMSHLRIATSPEAIQTVRIAPGGARLLLGCDLVVAGGKEALATLAPERGHAVVNTHEMMTGDFTRNADFSLPAAALRQAIERAAGERAHLVPATRLASALLGDAIATNLFMVGLAYQLGLVPVSAAAIERAIEINRVAVGMNRSAFRWGRRAAHDLAAVETLAAPEAAPGGERSRTLDELIERRVAHLTAYQDAAYAERYRRLVDRVRAADAGLGRSALGGAVARYYAKLLAYKDEYEVARLYTDGAFMAEIGRRFEGAAKLELHLAPPLLAARDPATGHLRKRTYGPWIFTAMRYLARLKGLRGRWLDPFGHSAERRTERRLIADYERTMDELLGRLSPENYGLAVEIASIPERIRGYGHVKQRHLDAASLREAELLAAFRAPASRLTEAA